MRTELSAVGEFARGWKIILASTVGIGLGLSPLPFYTIGMFAPELAKAFGWGFGDIMAGIMVMTLSALVASPLVGSLADRFGVRNVALVSLVLFAFSFASFALGNGSVYLFYLSWAAMAFLGAGTLPITWTRAVNLWFNKKKGLALGLSLTGTGIFGALLKPLTAWLILEFGWRTAYLALSALPIFVALPIAWWLFQDAPDQLDDADADDDKSKAVSHNIYGLSLIEALRSYRFWVLVVAIIPISFALGGPIPNMENLLSSKGFSGLEIASIVPLIGISVLVGRTVGGFVVDYFWAPAVAFILLSLPALACWMLSQSDITIASAMISVFLIGFASGVEYDLIAFLIARYFGIKAYSTIYGFIYGAFALGAGFGPLIFGRVFDQRNSYDDVLFISIILLLAGALLLLALGRYRYTTNSEN